MPQSCIPRIRQMEEIYDRVRTDIATLREYEESGQWLQDYEADEIFVINVGGYIGQSTRSEIAYALAHGKKVTYLEEV